MITQSVASWQIEIRIYATKSKMRKSLPVLILLFVLIGVLAFVIVRSLRSRHVPTPVGWRAHVTTLAGDGSPGFNDNVQARQASFADPFGLAIGSDGTIYVSDAGENNRIRKVATDGTVSTIAGGGTGEGSTDGSGATASFNSPSGLALDDEGNLYIADTGNNRIRKVTTEGLVSTIAGDGSAGFQDGPGAQARFDGPIGIAVDADGNVYVADSYNDRIRMITTAGQVSTVAGSGHPGYADGDAGSALFDTPCGLAVASDGSLIVADTGNNLVRRITREQQITTLPVSFPDRSAGGPIELRRPAGLALTHDGFIYVTELDRSRVTQIAADGTARVVAGGGPGYAEGQDGARFNQPAGIAIDSKGDLYVADSGNYLVRRLSQSSSTASLNGIVGTAAAERPVIVNEPLPRLNPGSFKELIWPLDPQERPHEVVATMGEVRGRFNSTDSRDHLHSGLDVFGVFGDMVRVIRSEKVASPLANWGFGDLNEGMRVGLVSYIHIHVGRDIDGQALNDPRFIQVSGQDGKPSRVRIRRGTRFRPGDAVGTVNRMYHVHLNIGPSGAEMNPLSMSPIGFVDTVAPVIEKDGIKLFEQSGAQLVEKNSGRLVVHGKVRIVVDAFDRTNMNGDRRRLGLYRLGYQILKVDGTPAPGFEQPRINIEFNRLPSNADAVKLAYADQSGITVYGNQTTRFLYEITNTVRDGRALEGLWDAGQLASGEYILRIIAADYSGNEAVEGRDVLILVR